VLPLSVRCSSRWCAAMACRERNARWVALYTTLITFAVSLVLVWRFDPTCPSSVCREA